MREQNNIRSDPAGDGDALITAPPASIVTPATASDCCVRGRVSIAFPADFDVAQAAECLETALNRSESLDSMCAGSFQVHVDHVTKATLSVDFIATPLDTVGSLDTSSLQLTRGEVASRLAAHQEELKQSLANCVVWLGDRHHTANFLISKRPLPTLASATVVGPHTGSSTAATITKRIFGAMCRANVFDVVDSALTQTAMQLAASENGTEDEEEELSEALRNECLRTLAGVLAPKYPCKECERLRAQHHQQQELQRSQHMVIASLRQDNAERKCEVECIGASHRGLEGDVEALSIARNELMKSNKELKAKLNASELEAEKLRAEVDVWRRRAEDADSALMLTVEVAAPPEDTSTRCEMTGGGNSQSSTTAEDDFQLVQKILALRETQVAQLNKQLIASRKETTESRRQVQQQQLAMREWANATATAYHNNGSSSRSSSLVSSLGPSTSRGGSEEQLGHGGDISAGWGKQCDSVHNTNGDDMVSRSAVLALERRCEGAERELRERTMQIAELLKVRREL
jgi:hypothetical protein